jgi:hypothetical protein
LNIYYISGVLWTSKYNSFSHTYYSPICHWRFTYFTISRTHLIINVWV